MTYCGKMLSAFAFSGNGIEKLMHIEVNVEVHILDDDVVLGVV